MSAPNPLTAVDSQFTVEARFRATLARLADYLELAKPRIVVLELCVAAAVAHVAAPRNLSPWTLLSALAATALVAGSASIANQCMERGRDGIMKRTADRPLVVGRVSVAEAVTLSLITFFAGAFWLGLQVNWATAGWGAASWVIYVAIYTPLKTRSSINTVVGAVAGAIPVLMGWSATGRPLNLTAWALAGVLFLWQFPHFMAIAWLHRRDYAAAGHRMLPVVDPTGIRSGVQALTASLALIPVSLIPAIGPTSGSPLVYSIWAVVLGSTQLLFTARFALARDERSARHLLRVTLIYMPSWLAVLLMVAT